jgi:hypothetical protein
MWRRRGEPLLAHLTEVEAAVLAGLIDELDELAADPPDGVTAPAKDPAPDPVRARLFPAGYRDDDAAAADFRELTQSSLARERRDRYRQCQAELPVGGGELAIDTAADSESAQRWLIVLNDMRLALGTRLGVTADGFAEEIADTDGGEPELAARAAYYWLTTVQDDLVTSVMER